MKINVGDYVRTKTGHIGKVIDFRNDPTDYYFNCYETNITETGFIDKFVTEYSDIKSSPNIIDLIEVGDYVNGWRVNRVEKQEDGIFLTIGNISSFVSKNETDPYLTKDHNGKNRICKMESIVTKEQFEEMQYLVKED